MDKTQRLNASTTATYRAFYDGMGHLVETRSPAPGGQDVVRYSFYDPSQRLVFQSVPYLVNAYTGGRGAAAYSIPDSTVAGTTSAYDGLGRLTSSTDALSFQSRKSYSVVCGPAGTGDAGCYEQTLSIDAKGHQGGTLVDGLGRTAYVQRYTGRSSSNYALYATARYTYDYAGDLTRIVHPDGSTQTTFGYDMAGRKTAMSDPTWVRRPTPTTRTATWYSRWTPAAARARSSWATSGSTGRSGGTRPTARQAPTTPTATTPRLVATRALAG